MEALELDEVDHRPTIRAEPGLPLAGELLPSRLVVAEDDDELRALLVERFAQAGYEVIPVCSGTELREVILQALHGPGPVPDAIVSDIRMPGCTALQILEAVRSFDWALPVVLLTAFGDRETHAEATRLGAAALLDKPFDLDELRLVVTTLVPPR